MANTHNSKAKLSQKCKRSENKKVAPPGFEPGSPDPMSDALPQDHGGGKKFGPKIMVLIPAIQK